MIKNGNFDRLDKGQENVDISNLEQDENVDILNRKNSYFEKWEMSDSGSLQGATTGFSFVLNFLNFKRSEESEMTS